MTEYGYGYHDLQVDILINYILKCLKNISIVFFLFAQQLSKLAKKKEEKSISLILLRERKHDRRSHPHGYIYECYKYISIALNITTHCKVCTNNLKATEKYISILVEDDGVTPSQNQFFLLRAKFYNFIRFQQSFAQRSRKKNKSVLQQTIIYIYIFFFKMLCFFSLNSGHCGEFSN